MASKNICVPQCLVILMVDGHASHITIKAINFLSS